MAISAPRAETAWARGRLDGRPGPSQLLFGRMHEDHAIERAAFERGARVFCIASAGCTALALAPRHEVVAVDINPAQVEYARRRFSGDPGHPGAVERVLALGLACAWLVGWSEARRRAFLALGDPAVQADFWRRHLDTRRFRAATDVVLSRVLLRAAYAAPFLRVLPRHFGPVMRGRLARGFARHPNRDNPYARALLLGELVGEPAPPEARRIRLVCEDAASHLEREPAGSFGGFTLSNILDGATEAYRERLRAAVRRAAAAGAAVVVRSLAEASGPSAANRAADDRSMLWGIVDVVPAESW